MKNCPVCRKELGEVIPEVCEICDWNLSEDITLFPVLNEISREEIEEYKKKVETAKEEWKIKTELKKKTEEKRSKCPVCNNQLPELIPEFCDVCGWNVGEDLTLQPILNMPDEEDIARYKRRLENARKIWGKKQEEKALFEKKLEHVEEEKIQKIVIPEQKVISQGNTNDNMVFVEGGTFTMGDTFGGGSENEKPIHEVTLDSFYIGKYPVTQKEYEDIMGYNPSYFKGANNPVEMITWYDAVMYANKLSEREGLKPYYNICILTKDRNNITNAVGSIAGGNGYKLPTESEWEYAARGGNQSKGYIYSGSNDVDEVTWYISNSKSKSQIVGQKKANELGIYDMSGNVWEWCWDAYSRDSLSNKINVIEATSSKITRVSRGGSYSSGRIGSCVSARFDSHLDDYSRNIGFRLAKLI